MTAPAQPPYYTEGGETMSEKEKRIAESITKLPDPLQDRFLNQIQGAVMALDMLGTSPPEKPDGDRHA